MTQGMRFETSPSYLLHSLDPSLSSCGLGWRWTARLRPTSFCRFGPWRLYAHSNIHEWRPPCHQMPEYLLSNCGGLNTSMCSLLFVNRGRARSRILCPSNVRASCDCVLVTKFAIRGCTGLPRRQPNDDSHHADRSQLFCAIHYQDTPHPNCRDARALQERGLAASLRAALKLR